MQLDTMPQHTLALSPSAIAPKVHWIRHEKVILDFDLAALYGVETRVLKQAVRRNHGRFPEDFLFVLTTDETGVLVSQSVIPGRGKFGGAAPYAFTEQGVAMLSSVLRSTRAVQVNIAIMRTFVQLRRLMDSNRDLARRIDSLENKYDEQFRVVFDAIKRLILGWTRFLSTISRPNTGWKRQSRRISPASIWMPSNTS